MSTNSYIRAINVGFLTEAWPLSNTPSDAPEDDLSGGYDYIDAKRERFRDDFPTKVQPFKEEIYKMSAEALKQLIVHYYETNNLLDIDPWTDSKLVDQRDLKLYILDKIREYESSKTQQSIADFLKDDIDVSRLSNIDVEKYYYDQHFKYE